MNKCIHGTGGYDGGCDCRVQRRLRHGQDEQDYNTNIAHSISYTCLIYVPPSPRSILASAFPSASEASYGCARERETESVREGGRESGSGGGSERTRAREVYLWVWEWGREGGNEGGSVCVRES